MKENKKKLYFVKEKKDPKESWVVMAQARKDVIKILTEGCQFGGKQADVYIEEMDKNFVRIVSELSMDNVVGGASVKITIDIDVE